MMTESDLSPASLRKAAVLLSSLDEATANSLLEQLPESDRYQLRLMLNSLDCVGDDERQEIVQQLVYEGRRRLVRNAGESDDLALIPSLGEASEADEVRNPRTAAWSGHESVSDGISFRRIVDTIPTSMLVAALRDEHPQMIAVVATRMSPERAGVMLAELDACLQVDVARRVADMGPPDPEIVADIEVEIVRRLTDQVQQLSTAHQGNATLQTILMAADGPCRTTLLRNIECQDARLAARLGLSRPTTPADSELAPSLASLEPGGAVRAFDDLSALDDWLLGEIFYSAGAEITALALSTADAAITQRVLSVLPSDLAGEIDQRLAALVPLRIGDIDRAQQEILRRVRDRISD